MCHDNLGKSYLNSILFIFLFLFFDIIYTKENGCFGGKSIIHFGSRIFLRNFLFYIQISIDEKFIIGPFDLTLEKSKFAF